MCLTSTAFFLSPEPSVLYCANPNQVVSLNRENQKKKEKNRQKKKVSITISQSVGYSRFIMEEKV